MSLCVGLDPSGFKVSTHEGDEEEQLMSVLATEEEKYSSCKKIVFECPNTHKQIILDQGVFIETVSSNPREVQSC